MTSIESTWGIGERLLFLGEWCKRYERKSHWSAREHETVPFHWDDRGKLDRDYEYLARLHRSLLQRLSAALNGFHGADHSVRYWQILLDPWLLSYVSVMFDRWESMTAALAGRDNLAYVPLGVSEKRTPPFSYVEFIGITQSDEWNQQVYQEILDHGFASRCERRPAATASESTPIELVADDVPRRRSVMSIALALLDRTVGRVVQRYPVVFLGAGFSPAAFVRLNGALGQVPRSFAAEFGSTSAGVAPAARSGSGRSAFDLERCAVNEFERYLEATIVSDLPTCVVEDLAGLTQKAKAVTLRTKVIVSGSHHWNNAFAKTWVAEQVERGVRLVVVEHGGSLPPYRELFDFDVDISDAKTTWFASHHPKHVQLPAPKLIGRFPVSRRDGDAQGRDWCSVIGNECLRWVLRAHFYPMAHQWSTSFDMTANFHDALDDRIKAAFRVKPYNADQGWNTRARLVERFGQAKVLSADTIDRVFANSRVVVCTYPETTFAEAMTSGVPTVLVYPPHLYELNAVAVPLLNELIAARIVFHDASLAASHVNDIWADPQTWWSSSEVRRVRDAFDHVALGMSGDWLSRWKPFLQTVSK